MTALTFLIERFQSKIIVKGLDECWECIEPATGEYGRFWDRHNHKYLQAHRVAWELANGPIPEGMEALHKCDNKRCCNPKHLYIGTQSDNMCDRVERSTGGNGRSNMMSKDDILNINNLINDNISQRKIAKMYGISTAYVSLLHTGKRGINIT
jgi:hypothetical protein